MFGRLLSHGDLLYQAAEPGGRPLIRAVRKWRCYHWPFSSRALRGMPNPYACTFPDRHAGPDPAAVAAGGRHGLAERPGPRAAASAGQQPPAGQPPPARHRPTSSRCARSSRPSAAASTSSASTSSSPTGKGKPVLDLKPEDFEVTEDNKPQKVEQFTVVKIDARRAERRPPDHARSAARSTKSARRRGPTCGCS